MDYANIYSRLVPGYTGTGCFQNQSFVWTDARVQPTEEECLAEQEVYELEEAVKLNNIEAHERYIATLDLGYLHTDSNTYYCDERATSDLTKVLTLYNLDPSEPVFVILRNNTPASMTYVEFVAMAKAVGQYQYNTRKILWSELM